jgi:hypothetical protein
MGAQCELPDTVKHAKPAMQSADDVHVAPVAPVPNRAHTVSAEPVGVLFNVSMMLHAVPVGQSVPKTWHAGLQFPVDGIDSPMGPTHTDPVAHCVASVQRRRQFRIVADGDPVFEHNSPAAQSSCPTSSGGVPVRVHGIPSAVDPVIITHAVSRTIGFDDVTSVHFAPVPHAACCVMSQQGETIPVTGTGVDVYVHLPPPLAVQVVDASPEALAVPVQVTVSPVAMSCVPVTVPWSGTPVSPPPIGCGYTVTPHPI